MKRSGTVRASFAADAKAQVPWLRASEREDWVFGLRTGLAEVRRLLARFPEAGRRVEEREGVVLRKLVLRKLPFVVWYAVDGEGVHLLRLFHVRQDRARRTRTRR